LIAATGILPVFFCVAKLNVKFIIFPVWIVSSMVGMKHQLGTHINHHIFVPFSIVPFVFETGQDDVFHSYEFMNRRDH
jgi:hypothetical protein